MSISGSPERLLHVAVLNKLEMLPWNQWGGMPRPDEPLQHDRLPFFDELAAHTRSPNTSFAELRTRYERDDRLRVLATVHNAVLNREEAI